MSTIIKSKMKDHTICSFYGGSARGVCLQITASAPVKLRETAGEQLQEESFIQLTLTEASALRDDLEAFIQDNSASS